MSNRFLGKKVIVTGNAGFVGSHLADQLILEGAEVYGLDNMSSGDKKNINPLVKHRYVDFVNKDNLFDYFEFVKPDYVFHVGAWGRMPMCLEDPIGAYQNNVMGTINVLEASRRQNVKKVVLMSSCIVYCEETPYKSSKVALEDIARVYRKQYGLSTLSLRCANIYGTRQNIEKDSAMFAMLRKSYDENKEIRIFGDGEQTRDWTNVKDIVEANLLGALASFEGEVDVCTGKSISLNYIVDILKGITPDLKVLYLKERQGDAKHINLNPLQAKEAFEFEAKINFEEGIKEIWH